jgi:hypothetical protein
MFQRAFEPCWRHPERAVCATELVLELVILSELFVRAKDLGEVEAVCGRQSAAES